MINIYFTVKLNAGTVSMKKCGQKFSSIFSFFSLFQPAYIRRVLELKLCLKLWARETVMLWLASQYSCVGETPFAKVTIRPEKLHNRTNGIQMQLRMEL